MDRKRAEFLFSFIIIILACFLFGCFNKGPTTDRLYFEPPTRLIDNYSSMVEEEEVNWAWLKFDVRFGNYRSITIKPFQNLSFMDDQNISERLYKELTGWFKESGIEVSDNGEIICEGAVVELIIERGFFKKVNPLYERENDFYLEVELVIKEDTTQNTICKIRHGAVGNDIEIIIKRLQAGLFRYFDSHK